VDVDLLNDTSPGKEHHVGFLLPDYVHERLLEKQETEYYAQMRG
jgi:hypothetical protein